MSPSDDPFAGLGGDGSALVDEPSTGWRSGGAQAAFWIVAGIGVLALCSAWFWYGLAFFDEMTEECKSLAAGSSGSGFAAIVGGVPLVFVHIVFLAALMLISARYHASRARGAVLALVVIVVASAVGIAVNELLWTGELFTMSAENAQCSGSNP